MVTLLTPTRLWRNSQPNLQRAWSGLGRNPTEVLYKDFTSNLQNCNNYMCSLMWNVYIHSQTVWTFSLRRDCLTKKCFCHDWQKKSRSLWRRWCSTLSTSRTLYQRSRHWWPQFHWSHRQEVSEPHGFIHFKIHKSMFFKPAKANTL